MTRSPPSPLLRELFDAALVLDPAARPAFLDAHCSDAATRAQLDRLLAAAGDDGEPLSNWPATRLAVEIGDAAAEPSWTPGASVGAYALTEMLGEGGSATVFRASRDLDGVRQNVAIKLLRRGLYSPDAQRMFRRERQSLAALSHPNIAHLIDGGSTDTGVPYLVMEFVDGLPITRYASDHALGLHARLRLFTIVCHAVEAAHRSLIVHRDLKPSNILVTDKGEVKLLDFGIAKLLAEDATDDAGPTRTGYAPLTPAYAAPEQFIGEPVSTATDVYALGVVLHELLLGERPGRRPPQRPSQRVAETATSDPRGSTTTTALRNALRGDLDNILLKALADEPSRRYARAGDLADDIERHLDARPVSAHPPSRWYRTRKFVARNRSTTALSVLVAIALCVGIAGTLWQARKARAEAVRAQEAAAQSQAAAEELRFQFAYLDSLLQVLAPSTEAAREMDRSTLITEAARRAITELAAKPAVLASVELSLARVAASAGDYPQALALADQAHARRQALFGDDSPATAQALALAGDLLNASKPPQHEEALRRQQAAIAVLRRHAPETSMLIEALYQQSNTLSYLDRSEEIAPLLDEADALCRTAAADEEVCEDVWENQGIFYTNLRRGEHAIPPLERVYEARRRRLGDDHLDTLGVANNLAWAYATGGDIERGTALAKQAYATRKRIQAAPTQPGLLALRRYSRILAMVGETRLSAELNAEFLEQARALYGEDHRDTILAYMDAANAAYGEGLFAEAAGHYAHAASAYRKLPDGGGMQRVLADSYHGHALRELGRHSEALLLHQRTLAELQDKFADRTERIAAALTALATTLSALGRYEEALRNYDLAMETYRSLEGLSMPESALVAAFRAMTLFDMGRRAEAEAGLRASLEEIAAAKGLPPRMYWERFAFLVEVACVNGAADCPTLRGDAEAALQRPLPGIAKLRLRRALSVTQDRTPH